jgi:tetratricopeptide (TPR) repeat protein
MHSCLISHPLSITFVIEGDLRLPARPTRLAHADVAVWSEPVVLPTYLPDLPDRFPAYLDRRVYQGSSGRVFPLPFHDRISEDPVDHAWVGLHLENEYLRVLVLPELGGRIHYAVDRRTGYPLFYANPVIKPALVGLAGPWLAGGVEFNWPQHHRPATFLPVAWEIDESDGTVWCSDHDPFARMKGMHGIHLEPASTVLELRVRLYNRSDEPQTFLWWANVAAEVHSDYQSFFPADVRMVADHAKRAVTTFPEASGSYYGIDYPSRKGDDTRPDSPRRVRGDRLDWPRNIPVPTSYMCVGSSGDFFGGYDHRAQAGFVHWADHRFVVGKKQWTWGDSAFGHAWNRNLADDGSAYIELMAGAFTENQPDFSHITPGETKSFVQYWYPLAGTGPAVAATLDAALGVEVREDETVLRLDATADLGEVRLLVRGGGEVLLDSTFCLSPTRRAELVLPTTGPLEAVLTSGALTILEWSSTESIEAVEVQPATEPPEPAAIDSVEQLYLTGRHLEQYRHATRSPEPYWNEALSRDPGHWASHVRLAAQRYRQARYAAAEQHLRAAVTRLTMLNPNPEVGDAHYLLGLVLVRLGRDTEARSAFAKAAWLDEWVPAASLQMALVDARQGDVEAALRQVRMALSARPQHLQARNLEVVLLRRLGRNDEAEGVLAATLLIDPLDLWARHLSGVLDASHSQVEAETLLDIALEYARAGEAATAVELCDLAHQADRQRPLGQTACGVLADYLAAFILGRSGDVAGADSYRARARCGDRTWNFASRLDDVAALESALVADPQDATAAALLGHWLYANGRGADAVEAWQRSVAVDPSDPVVWRNLGVAAYNLDHDEDAALAAYECAIEKAPENARLLFESDQLWRLAGRSVDERLARLDARPDLVSQRDDLCVAYAHLLLSAGRSAEALELLEARRFQPWEGGEGQVLGCWERACLALARSALTAGDAATAVTRLDVALNPPESLGEARHPLASPAPILLALGDAQHAAGNEIAAEQAWRSAAAAAGDFTRMSPTAYSENTYFSILAARRFGDDERAEALVRGLTAHAQSLRDTPARIDFFATSLPALLLFHDDPQRQQDLSLAVVEAQLRLLTAGPRAESTPFERVLSIDPSHELALDLIRTLTIVGSNA